jgi:hypothetical protein
MFYEHDSGGRPRPLGGGSGPPVTPRFPAGPLRPARVALVELGRRWVRQRWGGRYQNLHWVGGVPSWVQSADHPRCPGCRKGMAFLVQIDSGLPRAAGQAEWYWGSGGVAYGFWCDGCRTSAWLWQCT